MSFVKARKNPITGAVVVADVVVKPKPKPTGAPAKLAALQGDILEACRLALAPHKVPAAIPVCGRDARNMALVQRNIRLIIDLPPEKWTPGYADFASARSGVM